MSDLTPVPQTVVEAVDRWVASELRAAQRYTNRSPLDESGVWDLHQLAASVYASGWGDGVRAELIRKGAARERERDAAQHAAEASNAKEDA